MVPIFGDVTHLRGCPSPLKNRICFSAHSQLLKGYSGFTDLIKNQSIGVAQGVPHIFVWIFEYATEWPFAQPKSADF